MKNFVLILVALILTTGAALSFATYFDLFEEEEEPNETNQTNEEENEALEETLEEINDLKLSLSQSSENSYQVNIDKGQNEIRTLQLVLKFDPTLVRVDSITKGTYFEVYIGEEVNNVQGYVTISGSFIGEDVKETSELNFATITYTKLLETEPEFTVVSEGNKVNGLFSSIINTSDKQFSLKEDMLTVN